MPLPPLLLPNVLLLPLLLHVRRLLLLGNLFMVLWLPRPLHSPVHSDAAVVVVVVVGVGVVVARLGEHGTRLS
jgi:hypothetical protein